MLTQSQVEAKVKSILAETLCVDEKIVDKAKDLRTDLGMDSFDEIMLATSIEDEFGFDFDDSSFFQLNTVEDLYNFVNNLVVEKQTA